MSEALPTPPDGWPGEVHYGVPLKAWHVYQQENGQWAVASEDVEGNLALRAYNVPTQDEAIHHEAEKMRANNDGQGEIVVEEPWRAEPDAEALEPHDFPMPRRAGE